jgi:glycosyltransferase involved in cell wall biosynthesis
MFLVLPSEWYENAPVSVLEAFAQGKPVIAARIGGIPELVIDGETGLLFEPGNAEDLRAKIEFLLTNPDLAREMGKKARARAESTYGAAEHYRQLLATYERARSTLGATRTVKEND